MFSHNDRISAHQMVRLLVLDLFTGACLFLPMALPRIAGKGGIFAYLMGIGLTMVYGMLISTCLSESSFKQWLSYERSFGARFCRFLCGVRCFANYIFLFGLFTTVLHDTFLYTMKKEWILAIMVLVLIYGGMKGIEVRARLAELFFYVVLIPIFLIVMFSLPEADWRQLKIQMDSGITDVIWGALVTWILMSPIEWAAYLSVDFTCLKESRVIRRAIVIGGFLAGIVYGLCIMVLGADGMANEHWPTVILMQIMKIPGGFVSRQDGLMLSFWIFAMYISLSGAISHASNLFGNKTKHPKGGIVFFVLLGAGLSLITGIHRSFLNFYFWGMIITGGIWCLVLLLCIWKMNKRKRITKLGTLLLILILGLSGCENYVELENREFVMAIGVDLGTEYRYRFTFTFPDFSDATGKEGKAKKGPITLEADSLEMAEGFYNQMSETVLDYGQLKILMFGKDVLVQDEVMDALLFEIKEKTEIARTVCLCESETRADEVLKADETLHTSVGMYLEQLFKNHHMEVILNDWLGGKNEKPLPKITLYGAHPGLILR